MTLIKCNKCGIEKPKTFNDSRNWKNLTVRITGVSQVISYDWCPECVKKIGLDKIAGNTLPDITEQIKDLLYDLVGEYVEDAIANQ